MHMEDGQENGSVCRRPTHRSSSETPQRYPSQYHNLTKRNRDILERSSVEFNIGKG